MLYRNRELDDAFAFISSTPFDVFCLQEVPEGFLERLHTLPCEIASRIDTEKVFPAGVVPMYNVILSRYPITNQGDISFDFPDLAHSWRARMFVWLMRPLHFSPAKNRGSLYADITINGTTTRVFCLHLTLAHPKWRLREFEEAMISRDPSMPTIVCGDFNVLEKPHITSLNWLMGGRASDMFLYKRERFQIEDRFVEHDLANPLRGSITHRFSRSQLDHILVSKSLAITSAAVIPNRIGSDHNPISVTIVPPVTR